jgi:serine/threonine-protein kinase 24/25/MST4
LRLRQRETRADSFRNGQVLFLIPKNEPPTLGNQFSKTFQEFVALCLQRDPIKVGPPSQFPPATPEKLRADAAYCFFSFQRPTAKDLLRHRFIKTAKKASFLTEVIERHQDWKAKGGARAAEEAEAAAYDAYVLFTLRADSRQVS